MNPYIKFVKICDFAFFGAPFLYQDVIESFCDCWGLAIFKKYINIYFFCRNLLELAKLQLHGIVSHGLWQ